MIVITTPTGNIGHRVLDRVLAGDQPVRVIVRDPAKLPADVRDRVEVIQGSHGDRRVVTRAFDGAETAHRRHPRHRRRRRPPAARHHVDRPAGGSGARPGGPVQQRHGRRHLGGPRKAGAVRADPR
ncbi:NAD(P)H-binding protein [Actinoallomurus sp. CA-142502]|uniref:NAD(P)H-binding protein n=1 Tax=Actinoallomurus sp. CA-142502 TaxID=3239885 RepID=UPI003D8E9E5B